MRTFNKALFYLIFCVFCFFTSCKKGKGEFTVKGKISDQTFGGYLVGATIQLYQVPVGSTFEELISSGTVASDGSYSFTFERSKIEKYILRISKSNYFDLEETIFFSSLSLENENIRNYGTTAKTWIKIRFQNQNPLSSDELSYSKQQGKSDCEECCSEGQQSFYGAIDTTFYCINDANELYSFFYGVTGTTVSQIVENVTVPFDTVEVYIPY